MAQLKKHKGTIFIVVLTALVYANTLSNGFVWDDWALMVPNETYTKFDLGKIFLSKANSLEYLPVRDLSLSLDAQVWGMKAFGFHLTNLVLYLLSLVVLHGMLRNLLSLLGEAGEDSVPFWTTLIFALHPLHAEPVNFIANRNTILAGLLLFLSCHHLINGIRGSKAGPIVSSAFLFLLSLFSKASVVFYPLIVAMILYLVPEERVPRGKKVLVLVPFAALAAIAIGIHVTIAGETNIMTEDVIRFGVNSFRQTAARALQIPFFYLSKHVFPHPLSVDYVTSFTSGAALVKSLLSGALVAVLIAAAWSLRKKTAVPLLGSAWFFLSLGPVLNIFPTTPVVADRYAYFAVLGFGLVFALVLKQAVMKKKVVLFAACGVLVTWAVMDISRNRDWRSDITLWRSAVAANADASRTNLAFALWQAGSYEESLEQFRQAHEKNPDFRYHEHLGKFLFRAGRYEEAIEYYRKALVEGGDAWKELHLYLAEAYEQIGQDLSALEHYQKSLEAKSLDPMGRYAKAAGKGVERIRNKMGPKLRALLGKASERPLDAQSQVEAAIFLHNLGLYDDAEAYYGKAIALNGTRWEVFYNVGLTRMRRAQYDKAIRSFEQSLRLDPGNREVLNGIGSCYLSMERYDEAIRYFEQAAASASGSFYPLFNLGKTFFITGDREKAKKYFAAALNNASGNPDLQVKAGAYLKELE